MRRERLVRVGPPDLNHLLRGDLDEEINIISTFGETVCRLFEELFEAEQADYLGSLTGPVSRGLTKAQRGADCLSG